MPYGKWATVTEASQHYGVTRQRIWQLIQTDRLGKCKLVSVPGGDIWLIPYPFSRETGKVGRPPVKRS